VWNYWRQDCEYTTGEGKKALYKSFILRFSRGYGKKSISLIRFGKFLKAYSKYKYECKPEIDRDGPGQWIRFRSKHELETNGELDMDF